MKSQRCIQSSFKENVSHKIHLSLEQSKTRIFLLDKAQFIFCPTSLEKFNQQLQTPRDISKEIEISKFIDQKRTIYRPFSQYEPYITLYRLPRGIP